MSHRSTTECTTIYHNLPKSRYHAPQYMPQRLSIPQAIPVALPHTSDQSTPRSTLDIATATAASTPVTGIEWGCAERLQGGDSETTPPVSTPLVQRFPGIYLLAGGSEHLCNSMMRLSVTAFGNEARIKTTLTVQDILFAQGLFVALFARFVRSTLASSITQS